MSHENQMDAAQALGLIKGLTAVVQEQSNAMKDTTDQIKQLATTVENLTKSQSQSQPQSMGLRLPILGGGGGEGWEDALPFSVHKGAALNMWLFVWEEQNNFNIMCQYVILSVHNYVTHEYLPQYPSAHF